MLRDTKISKRFIGVACGRTGMTVKLAAVMIAGSYAITGCGGGGGSSPSNNVVNTKTQQQGTATFHVDVPTGQVSVVKLDGVLKSNAVFAGSAVTFHTGTLVDQPGNTGIKVLNVSFTNNWGSSMGIDTNGNLGSIKVLFSNFTSVSAPSDFRTKTTVSTVAGSGAAGSDDGGVASATFNGILGSVTYGNTVYVTDLLAHKIRTISNGQVSTLAGSGGAAGTNGVGTAASFNQPFGIALNPVDGALIVTEHGGNRIRRVTRDGRVTTVAGTGAVGANNSIGTSATFNYPTGVAVDSYGGIYVAEYSGNKIRKIVLTNGADPTSPASYTVSTFAGSGTAGMVDGVGLSAQFKNPIGIAIGSDNALYVADSGSNAIRRITLGGAEVVTIAGTGTAGSADGNGDVATFNGPRGIAFYHNTLFVSEETGNRIRVVALKDGASPSSDTSYFVGSIAGTGSAGSTDGAGSVATFNRPELISIDSAGNIYVPDLNSRKLRQIAGIGTFLPIGTPDGGSTADPVQLSNQDGIIPSSGYGTNLPYISYNGPVLSGATSQSRPWWFVVPSGVTAFEFTVSVEAVTAGLVPPNANSGSGSPNVSVRTVAGVPNDSAYLDGQGSAARFSLNKYADVDQNGVVYVSDLYNNAIRRITPDGMVSTICGGPANNGTQTDGAGNVAKVLQPTGVAVNAAGTVVFFGDGNMVRRASIAYYNDPTNPGNWTVSTIAGKTTPGNVDGTGVDATFNQTEGIALDRNSNTLYVNEYSGNRVRKMYFKGGDPTAAANWQVILLAGDLSGSTSGTTDDIGSSARFYNPRGICVDRNGNVIVADTGNHRIRKIASNGTVSTIAGSSVGYTDGTTTGVQFASPYGVTCDTSGYIYVGEIGNYRIRRIDPAGKVTTVAGTGYGGGIVADGPGNACVFSRPAGVVIDKSGNLYVCDYSSVRLIERVVNLND